MNRLKVFKANRCSIIHKPCANETVLEGLIEVEGDLDITKEELGGLMTKMIVTQKMLYLF